jgi:hypothetical protein
LLSRRRIIHDFIIRSPFREQGLTAICLAVDDCREVPADRLHLLLLAQIRFLVADPDLSRRHRWRAASLLRLIKAHSDAGVRLLAIHCYARQMALSESGRSEMERRYVGSATEVAAQICYGWTVEKRLEGGSVLKMHEIDGWVMTMAEYQRNEKRECWAWNLAGRPLR